MSRDLEKEHQEALDRIELNTLRGLRSAVIDLREDMNRLHTIGRADAPDDFWQGLGRSGSGPSTVIAPKAFARLSTLAKQALR